MVEADTGGDTGDNPTSLIDHSPGDAGGGSKKDSSGVAFNRTTVVDSTRYLGGAGAENTDEAARNQPPRLIDEPWAGNVGASVKEYTRITFYGTGVVDPAGDAGAGGQQDADEITGDGPAVTHSPCYVGAMADIQSNVE